MRPLQRLRLEATPPITSAAALARKAGLSERVVQDVESQGRRPSDATLIKLAKALELPAVQLAAALADDAETEEAQAA